jgi:hypothetical protein
MDDDCEVSTFPWECCVIHQQGRRWTGIFRVERTMRLTDWTTIGDPTEICIPYVRKKVHFLLLSQDAIDCRTLLTSTDHHAVRH